MHDLALAAINQVHQRQGHVVPELGIRLGAPRHSVAPHNERPAPRVRNVLIRMPEQQVAERPKPTWIARVVIRVGEQDAHRHLHEVRRPLLAESLQRSPSPSAVVVARARAEGSRLHRAAPAVAVMSRRSRLEPMRQDAVQLTVAAKLGHLEQLTQDFEVRTLQGSFATKPQHRGQRVLVRDEVRRPVGGKRSLFVGLEQLPQRLFELSGRAPFPRGLPARAAAAHVRAPSNRRAPCP